MGKDGGGDARFAAPAELGADRGMADPSAIPSPHDRTSDRRSVPDIDIDAAQRIIAFSNGNDIRGVKKALGAVGNPVSDRR